MWCGEENTEMTTHKFPEDKLFFSQNGSSPNWIIDQLDSSRCRNPAICLWAKLKLES